MTTSSEFPEKPRSKSRERISSFMLKKSSTSFDSTTPWSKEETKHKLKNFEKRNVDHVQNLVTHKFINTKIQDNKILKWD